MILDLKLDSRISIFELLIGGPNQSHKVNFKEPPFRGKRLNKPDRYAFVKKLSEVSFRNFPETQGRLVKELLSPAFHSRFPKRKSSNRHFPLRIVKNLSEDFFLNSNRLSDVSKEPYSSSPIFTEAFRREGGLKHQTGAIRSRNFPEFFRGIFLSFCCPIYQGTRFVTGSFLHPLQKGVRTMESVTRCSRSFSKKVQRAS